MIVRMEQVLPYLHKPIYRQIDGRPVCLLTIGHVAHVCRRTTWTIKYWTKIGLFPEAPFLLYPEVPRSRRRLYPKPFVLALTDIVDAGYLGDRLDRDQWIRFRNEVFAAYDRTALPMLASNTARGVD